MEKIIQLANMIDGNAPDVENGRTAEDAGVALLASVINDDQAAVAMLCSTTLESAEIIASRAGMKCEDIEGTLKELGNIGILLYTVEDDVTKYQRVPWAPGICEHLLLNKQLQNEAVAIAFHNYTTDMDRTVGQMMGMGGGALRTIPIKASIEAETHIASYEEIQTYFDQSDLYSKADCACRLAGKLMGNACEHTIEGMCIQIGAEADYYIRSGRATQITREEAEEILRKAEREGLVHEIFNNEGKDKSTFICNCCGCSCASLRVATLFNNPDPNRSNFVAEVTSDKCVGCGACVENCNTNALALGSSFCKENQTPVMTQTPHDTDWTQEYWNPDFKIRKMVNEYGTAPCKTKCPAHVSVQGYIRKAAEGNFEEALKIIKRDNPFPAICGRVCPHGCESECTRANLDEAIAIDDIKKYIADKELESGNRYIPKIYEKRDGKVAIIGAGPAGLSCAYYLAVEGFEVCVYEKQKILGGMLTMGIPSFRLENEIIEAEIDVLHQLGVTFKTGIEVGKDITLKELRTQGYQAFFLAIGAQEGRSLNIEGEDLGGVITGVEFLRNISLTTASRLQGKTVVIGGGNVAIDVARSCVRMGSDVTAMYCLESKDEMPALLEEQEEAKIEGIEINNSWGPKRILGENGKVTGVEFMRCLSVFDENGRFHPVFNENETIIIQCSNVLVSVGQAMNWGGLADRKKMELTGRGTMVVDDLTLQTGESDVFAGGDAVTGPKFAIDAIASGKTAAISIKRYILGQNLKVRREREYHALDQNNLDLAGFDQAQRQKPASIDHHAASRSFKDLRTDLTDEQIKLETNRCLGCGVSVVDEYRCLGCGICATKCEFDAIKLKRKYNVGSAEDPEEWMKNFLTNAGERAERLANKKAAETSK